MVVVFKNEESSTVTTRINANTQLLDDLRKETHGKKCRIHSTPTTVRKHSNVVANFEMTKKIHIFCPRGNTKHEMFRQQKTAQCQHIVITSKMPRKQKGSGNVACKLTPCSLDASPLRHAQLHPCRPVNPRVSDDGSNWLCKKIFLEQQY